MPSRGSPDDEAADDRGIPAVGSRKAWRCKDGGVAAPLAGRPGERGNCKAAKDCRDVRASAPLCQACTTPQVSQTAHALFEAHPPSHWVRQAAVHERFKADTHEFVMYNFAPPDMVGHTGVFDAAVEAITATDAAVGTVYKACQEAGYILLITADHGNAEQMLNPDTGAPHTAHTTNKVPFIMTGDPAKFKFADD